MIVELKIGSLFLIFVGGFLVGWLVGLWAADRSMDRMLKEYMNGE